MLTIAVELIFMTSYEFKHGFQTTGPKSLRLFCLEYFRDKSLFANPTTQLLKLAVTEMLEENSGQLCDPHVHEMHHFNEVYMLPSSPVGIPYGQLTSNYVVNDGQQANIHKTAAQVDNTYSAQ
uniref:LisH domain-containing protein n=1 Tax=Ascaris lumbricoides TaxID=6252 RepID=A0A0M3IS37_ASCLU